MTYSLLLFDPRRTVQLQGFSGRAATTTLHDATETGFQISGIFQAAEDFANVQLFSAYDYFNHLRLKPLPVTDLSGLTLQFDMEILPINGEEGNVRPDCVRYASVGWDKLTVTIGAGDIYEVPLMHHAAVVSGDYTPGGFGFSLHDRDAATLDELLVGKATPALTDKAYVYFMGTRWSCSSAEAIAFCNLETRLLNNIGAPDVPSCEQAIWWQDDPNFWHYLLVNNGGAGIQEAGATDATDIASRLASMVGISSYLVDCTASGNIITVSLEPGVNGPVEVSTNSGSAPATLSRSVPGIYTAQVASSAEIRVGDYVGVDIGSANDEVVKVLAVGPGAFTAHFNHRHLAGAVCRVLPRARHFGRVLKNRMVDAPAPDYGEQPSSLAAEQFATTNTSLELKLRLVGPLGAYGRDANGMPVRVSVDGGNQIVRIEKKEGAFGATSFATAVEGAGNTRAYRLTFPFASLSGYLNGDRSALVPVPAGDIVKVHLTFAPRFEDVEAGLREGGRLKEAVTAVPPGTDEEWHLTDADQMLAGRKYYAGTPDLEERIACLANFGLVKPAPDDPATWYYRVLVRRGEDSSTPQSWPPGTRIQRISTITGTRSDIEWQSWGSHGITIWNDFRPAVFAREVDLGLKHFPKINVLRIWLSYDAWIADRTKFLSAVKQAAGILAERKLRMIPVFFNGWVALVYFGGFNLNQLRNSARNRNFGAHRQYLRETLEALRPSGNLLMYDISNEPFNQGGKEAGSVVVNFLRTMAEQIRTLDRKTPVSVGTIGMPSTAGGPEDLDLVDPFVDVHVVHTYRLHERAEEFAGMVAHLEGLGKPAIATECCWGSNDDAARAGYVRHDLTLLKRTGIGFLPHALHHSRVADLHRPVPGRDWNTMYMGFIDPGGSIRPGHEVYNEFCDWAVAHGFCAPRGAKPTMREDFRASCKGFPRLRLQTGVVGYRTG